MKKINQQGFSLIEVLFAAALLGLLITGLAGAIIYGQQSTQISGNRARAVFLAEEGLEAARNIRDQSFASLTTGTFGLAQTGNQWTLSGASDTTGIYTRQLAIADINAKTKQVTSTVTWRENLQRNGTVTVATQFTDWRVTPTPTIAPTPTNAPTPTPGQQSNYLVINTLGALLGSTFIDINGITLTNIGSSSLTIDKVSVSWTNVTRRVQDVQIGGNIVWSHNGVGTPDGRQPSGTQLDIENTTIPANTTVPINRIRFNGLMIANIFTVTVTMTDGSSKSVTGIGL